MLFYLLLRYFKFWQNYLLLAPPLLERLGAADLDGAAEREGEAVREGALLCWY